MASVAQLAAPTPGAAPTGLESIVAQLCKKLLTAGVRLLSMSLREMVLREFIRQNQFDSGR
jgi:hypothetical protein